MLMVLCLARAQAQTPSIFSVRDYGAKANGTDDDTAAFQKAMDAAGQAGGGTVMADRRTSYPTDRA